MGETVALIVAAGRGERAAKPGTNGEFPKQYWNLAGQPVLRQAVNAFLDQMPGDSIFVVIRPEHQALYRSAVADLIGSDPVPGGPARQDSVRLGLEAIAARGSPEKVLIHDASLGNEGRHSASRQGTRYGRRRGADDSRLRHIAPQT